MQACKPVAPATAHVTVTRGRTGKAGALQSLRLLWGFLIICMVTENVTGELGTLTPLPRPREERPE